MSYEKINVKISQGDKLIKELTEDNVIIITEKSRGEIFAHISYIEAAYLMAQLSNEYDRLLEWFKTEDGISSEQMHELVKQAKLDLRVCKVEDLRGAGNGGKKM